MKYVHILLLAATFTLPVVAQADVLHDQPITAIENGYCSPCTGFSDYRVFGSFSLTTNSILQSGRFAIGDVSEPYDDGDLNISIWDVPFGTELFSLDALEGSYTTTTPFDDSYYADIDLPNWPLPAGSYWISLFGINDHYLGWGTDATLGNDAQYSTDGNLEVDDRYVGFTLFGEPVPEPSSLLLCVIAVMLVGICRRR